MLIINNIYIIHSAGISNVFKLSISKFVILIIDASEIVILKIFRNLSLFLYSNFFLYKLFYSKISLYSLGGFIFIFFNYKIQIHFFPFFFYLFLSYFISYYFFCLTFVSFFYLKFLFGLASSSSISSSQFYSSFKSSSFYIFL